MTDLCEAVRAGDIDAVRALILSGADVNAMSEVVRHPMKNPGFQCQALN